jgi:hypothetical protein
MSDLRKWLTIMESVPAIFPNQPDPTTLIKKDATVMVSPSCGGGVGRYMHSTPNGAMIDIKGIARELSENDFSLPERDYEDSYQKGNDWFHMSKEPATPGRMNDKPEFRAGDMVKIADVYGSVIGPGFGVFIAYSTNGQECIVSFDDEEMLVPVENVGAVLEQGAKDNFDEMDNDGNLSPMSFGQENVKVEKGEPAMDHRDEFSKWVSTVEEALSSEEVVLQMPQGTNGCNCGSWDCQACYPDTMSQDNVVAGGEEIGDFDTMDACPTCGHSHEEGMHSDNDFDVIEFGNESATGMGAGGIAMGEDDALADFYAKGGKAQNLPYKGPTSGHGMSFASKHIGSAAGTGNRSQQRGAGANVSTSDKMSGKPVVGEEENTFIEKPKSGKGVKLGDIVKKMEFRKTGGQNSPMTYGDDNLGEGDAVDFTNMPDTSGDDYGKAGRYQQDNFGQMQEGDEEDREAAFDMIATIKYMQDMGLSNSEQAMSPEQMATIPFEELKRFHSEVTGSIGEATRPTKPKDPMAFNLDDMDDALNPRQADLPATMNSPDDDGDVIDAEPMRLPSASRDSTQNKLRNMSPSDTIRDYMSRIDRSAGADEPELPDAPTTDLTVRTATDVPAVISSAIQASGVENPEWHNVNNLPGFGDRNRRGIGRQVFDMFTSTPQGEIQVIANVGGQGPNTDAEMRAVAGWLRNNAGDLGAVDVNFGQAIPGYKPDVKEYRANGIRFHVVRDPMGQYIYAYPDKDARSLGAPQQRDQLPGGNTPRLRESKSIKIDPPTLFERIKWDEEVTRILKETEVEEAFGKPDAKDRARRTQAGYEKKSSAYNRNKADADAVGDDFDEQPPEAPKEKSTLARRIGGMKGGQRLIRHLHKIHKLSNEAELEPVRFKESLLWGQFKSNPDDFIIVSGQNGVAGIKPSQKSVDRYIKMKKDKGQEPNLAGAGAAINYQIIAFTSDGEQVDPASLQVQGDPDKPKDPDPTVIGSRMGKTIGQDMQNSDNTFSLLNDKIGPITTIWLAGWTGYRGDDNVKKAASPGAVERDKIAKRAELTKTDTMSSDDAMANILKRVRPVLKTLANQALSQINRTAQRYINGGNFEGAQKVAASGQKLKSFLVTLDTAKDISLDANNYGNPDARQFAVGIQKAISRASGAPPGSKDYKEYMISAAQGNSAQLRPILDGLRDTLVGL